ncbi:MAG: hypothetical protein BGO07_00020 [Alphaproteobacteria bacterium 40-19]|nr:MAG: hypothetical protein BGO07_00020 [Alphaproteobacteria bacterium 40-19]
MRRVVIAGVGRLGTGLVHYLSTHYEVVAIDTDAGAIARIQDRYDVQGVVGNVCDPYVLRKANLDPQCAFLVITGSDEVNLVACQLDQMLFHASFKALRLRHAHYLEVIATDSLLQQLKIDWVIRPWGLMAEHLQEILKMPGIFDHAFFVQNRFQLLGIHVQEKHFFHSKTIKDIEKKIPQMRLMMAFRKGERIEVCQDTLLVKDDFVYLLTAGGTDRSSKNLFFESYTKQRFVFLGAHETTYGLLESLKDQKVLVIGQNKEHTEKMAILYPEYSFIYSPTLDQDVWQAIDEHPAYVMGLSESDEQNLTTCLIARQKNSYAGIAMTENMQNFHTFFKSGLACLAYPLQTVVSGTFKKMAPSYLKKMWLTQGDQSLMVAEVWVQENVKALYFSWEKLKEYGIHVVVCIRKKKAYWSAVALEAEDTLILWFPMQDYDAILDLFGTLA